MTLALIAMMAGPAFAGDYPFTGIFTFKATTTPPTEAERLKCAFNFFTQGADGRGRDYALDRQRFAATGEIVFQPLDRFQCRYDPTFQTEHCSFEGSADPTMPGRTFAKVLEIMPGAVTAATFTDLASLADYVGGGSAEEPPLGQYLRCAIDPAKLEPLLAEDVPRLTPDQVMDALADPFADGPHPDLQVTARAVLAALAPSP